MTLHDITQKLNKMEMSYVDLAREVVRLRQLYEDKEKLRPIFLESTPSNKIFRKKVIEVLSPLDTNISLKLDVIGFVDNTLLDKLETCAKRVRIVCHDQKKHPKEVESAIKRLLEAGAEIRSHREMHARMIRTNNHIIIGSGDLQADSLDANRTDACIWSNHPEILTDTKIFFEKIWNESTPVGDTLLLRSDFSKYREGSSPYDPWRVNQQLGTIKTVKQSEVGGSNQKKCLKITSPTGSHDYLLYRFRDCKQLKLAYRIRHQSFNAFGLGAGFHIQHTPENPSEETIEENFAVWMGIRQKQLQWYDTEYHKVCPIKPKKWYNISVSVDCNEQAYSFKVDGKEFEGNFRHYLDTVNTIRTNSWKEKTEWTTYIDQVILHKIS
ncbi:MAG: hypothetical protein NWE89_06510 [Candidatus Bathyarchaeota archaeon]|nr:hypothetical protein [Candidatus Bathyarchaeota archaeon]